MGLHFVNDCWKFVIVAMNHSEMNSGADVFWNIYDILYYMLPQDASQWSQPQRIWLALKSQVAMKRMQRKRLLTLLEPGTEIARHRPRHFLMTDCGRFCDKRSSGLHVSRVAYILFYRIATKGIFRSCHQCIGAHCAQSISVKCHHGTNLYLGRC